MPNSYQGASLIASSVPCGNCTLCCRNHQAIILHPEMGDDPSKYPTVEIVHPLTGEPALMIAQRKNGDCVNLSEKGCSVYADRPIICREYDCRKQYMSLTKATRQAMLEGGVASKATFDAGRNRLTSLTREERQECIARRKASV